MQSFGECLITEASTEASVDYKISFDLLQPSILPSTRASSQSYLPALWALGSYDQLPWRQVLPLLLWKYTPANGSPLQCSCLENPRDGGARRAVIYGVTESRTRLKQLSSSSNPVKGFCKNPNVLGFCRLRRIFFGGQGVVKKRYMKKHTAGHPFTHPPSFPFFVSSFSKPSESYKSFSLLHSPWSFSLKQHQPTLRPQEA